MAVWSWSDEAEEMRRGDAPSGQHSPEEAGQMRRLVQVRRVRPLGLAPDRADLSSEFVAFASEFLTQLLKNF